ncbi:MAG: hypothetical protein ABH878_10590 [bacterium]
MQITHVEIWPVEMKLAESYTIAYETVASVTNIIIRIETNTGIEGYGCAAPDKPVTGETPEGALQALRDVAMPLLKGADPLRRIQFQEQLKKTIPDQPSVRAAVDMALHDLLGRVAGVPLWKLLGGYRTRMRTSVTIGIMSVADTVSQAEE